MNDALYIAATGMNMEQMNVDTIANNLANINTPGFKKGRVNFQDLVYRTVMQASNLGETQESVGPNYGRGVGLSSLSRLFTSGELKKTDNPLDVAIRGSGFFEVTMPDGSPAYSRGGSLHVNKDGFLATTEGNPLKPNIYIGSDAKEVVIDASGRVMIRGSSQETATEVGHIELVNFADASGLIALGDNQYQSSALSGEAIYGKPGEDSLGTIVQGSIESSNVKMIDEMVNLMVAQRAYEMNVKVIQASDEMLAMSNNLRR